MASFCERSSSVRSASSSAPSRLTSATRAAGVPRGASCCLVSFPMRAPPVLSTGGKADLGSVQRLTDPMGGVAAGRWVGQPSPEQRGTQVKIIEFTERHPLERDLLLAAHHVRAIQFHVKHQIQLMVQVGALPKEVLVHQGELTDGRGCAHLFVDLANERRGGGLSE